MYGASHLDPVSGRGCPRVAPTTTERASRGIYNRLAAGGRFSLRQSLSEIQRRLNTVFSASGYSACHLVFGLNPAGLSGCENEDEDLLFAQETSPSGQFA